MKPELILFILVGLVIAGILTFLLLLKNTSPPILPKSTIEFREGKIHIRNIEIPVEIADTPATRKRGLSSREYLAPGRGMLFVFEKPGKWQFWMMNVQFPLDFIWIDSDHRVIGVTPNVPPLKDLTRPIWHTPPSPVKYVLEVNAGFAAKYNIQPGDEVLLSNI